MGPLKRIDELTTVPILDDDEIVKKLISLNVTIDLDDFIQLTHGVESVMLQKFGHRPKKYQT